MEDSSRTYCCVGWSLYARELSYYPRHTSDQSGSCDNGGDGKDLREEYGKPHKPRLKIEEEVAESKLCGIRGVGCAIKLWQQIKQLIVPEKQIVFLTETTYDRRGVSADDWDAVRNLYKGAGAMSVDDCIPTCARGEAAEGHS